MTIRVNFAGPDNLFRSERIVIADVTEAGVAYFLPDGDSVYFARAGEMPPDHINLHWNIPTEALGALLAGLQKHLGGVDVSSAMRKDYEREQARVDRMIDALIASKETDK